MKRIAATVICFALAVFGTQNAEAATMTDYCITPPYIGSSIEPNLMLLLDNSASMYDLAFTDQGTTTRTASYCYDNTYKSTMTYDGYFKSGAYYDYSFTNGYFSEIASFPADSECSDTLARVSGNLFVCYDTTARVATRFLAKGNYLNWLSMSKFDVEKYILTGGKYETGGQLLLAESRGCVGHLFVKQPLAADYVEGGTNTPLGITFGISGPTDPYNPSAPSPGGQTYIKVFLGQYNAEVCQNAVDDFADPAIQKSTLMGDIADCIGYSSTNRNTCQYHSAQTCNNNADCFYSFTAGTCGAFTPNGTCGPLSGGVCSVSTAGICNVNNGTCPSSGSANGTCVGGNRAGSACTNNRDCTGNGICTRHCVGGGNAGRVCGTDTVSSNATCASSACTSGNTARTSCAVNSDCDLKNCTNAGMKLGLACSTDSDCNSGTCSAGAVGFECLTNSDCNTSTAYCATGQPATTPCTANSDCNVIQDTNGWGPCVPPASVQIKSTYGQTMHTCYQLLFKGQSLTQDDLNTISGNNGCNIIYHSYYTCQSGSRDGSTCTGAADCPGGSCINGPNAIRPGSPVLICGSSYAGYCASSADGWAHTTWNAREFATADACVTAAIAQYCNVTQVPNVTDPTVNADVTAAFANLPAILNDTGLEGQLGNPIAQVAAIARRTVEPTGLIQQYSSNIRMGAMTFNVYGSPTECTPYTYPPLPNTVPCPKICSTDPTRTCGSNLDCPFPDTATCTLVSSYMGAHYCYYAGSVEQVSPLTTCVSDAGCGIGQTCLPSNKDAAEVIFYVGYGTCYDDSTKTQIAGPVRCATDAGCGANQYCQSDGVGDHTTGLVSAIDRIKGSSWTPFSEAFYDAVGYYAKDPADATGKTSRTDLRVNNADYSRDYNPSQLPCQSNNLLLITDGMSTADQNTSVQGLATLYRGQSPLYNTTGLCPAYRGSTFLENLSWLAQNRDISAMSLSVASTAAPTNNSSKINTYVVFSNSGGSNNAAGDCNSQTLLSNTATNGGTALFLASDLTGLNTALKNAFDQVATRAASGTAASVLASGEGSGANLIQAVFYPHKKFANSANFAQAPDEIEWVGRLTNLWYYVDPFINTSSIREDNGCPTCTVGVPNQNPGGGDKTLDLLAPSATMSGDYIINMRYDKIAGATLADRWLDPAGNGVIGTQISTINFEDLGYLWEAGTMLWKRDLSVKPRTLYTNCSIDASTCIGSTSIASFSTSNASALAPYLGAADTATAANIISWVTGSDVAGYRSRTVKMEAQYGTSEPAHVWKLGDVINSTPRLMSWQALNNYYNMYGDNTYGYSGSLESPADSGHFVTTTAYKRRGMIFAGGNDGMLHAFKLGTLRLNWGQGVTQKARLENPDTGAACASTDATPCGAEVWAFIPKNILPYLQYLADRAYCHLYSIDLSPYIFDASINGGPNIARTASSWRTVVIGGMRFGGACSDTASSCTNCVKTPLAGVGYSSYFAIDVTDPNSPTLMWEFSDPGLGFTTSGPAVMRINGDGSVAHVADKDTNGNWFVVFGSGPTGPISTQDHQFLGRSDQSLKLFVLNLKDGTVASTIDTGIANAFSGSLLGATMDVDTDYQDEVLYVPYVKKASDGTWTSGGIGRLVTKKNASAGNWSFSKIMDGVGPVTASVVKIYDSSVGNLWLYFGTGRYYFVQNTGSDDPNGQRYLFGLKDPCMSSTGSYNFTCSDSRVMSDLTDVTSIDDAPDQTTANATGFKGWYLAVDPAGEYTYPPDAETSFTAERVITDPLAASSGVIYFTSYKPFTNLCLLGGKSFIWAMQYNTGGAPTNLKGKVLIQVSTGAIEQRDLASTFTGAGGRKSAAIEGKPPEMQGLSVLAAPPPVNRIIHIKER